MSGLVTRRHPTAASFVAAATPFLLTREAEHCLMLGICSGLPDGMLGDDGPWLATATRDASIVAVALHWGPFDIVLSHVDDPAIAAALCDQLVADGRSVPGVFGAEDAAVAFADRWVEHTGGSHTLRSSERVHRLRRVRPPAPAPGHRRTAMESDREILRAWMTGFHREALDHALADPDATVDEWLGSEHRALFLWDTDHGPVSMTGTQGRTPSGIRVSAVYTPPDHRRRGYAGNLVAAVSQAQLDAGRAECYIYTDLANPTSNHVYTELGYEPVADVVHIAVVPAEPG